MKRVPDPKSHNQRGLALIGVVGILLVLLVFAGGMVAQLAYELNSVRTDTLSNRALAAADAGVHAMIEQIQYNEAHNLPPPGPTPVTFTYPEPVGTPAATSYSSQIDNQWQAGGINYYLITSTGTFNNVPFVFVSRKVRAIAKSVPISNWDSWSGNETNQFGNAVWYRSDTHYNGPVYSSGPMRIDYAGVTGVTPIFQDKVRTAISPVWNDQADMGSPPSDSADWGSIVAGGQNNFTIDKSPLALPAPKDNLFVMSQAWEGDGAKTAYPTVPNGVYMDGKDASTQTATLTTGVYINTNGATVTIDGSSSGSTYPGTETFTLQSKAFGGQYYQVTESFTGLCTGTTTVGLFSGKPPTGTFIRSGSFVGVPCGAPGPGVTNPGNGAIFVNGSVAFGGVSPNVSIKGSYAFVTPDYSPYNDSILVRGNFQYSDPTADKVALWANRVLIANASPSNMEIDASIIAGYPGEAPGNGYFAYLGCGSRTCGADKGTLTVLGGVIENTRGAVGAWVGGVHTGYSRNIKFDSRFATSPPPFNPMTGEYDLIAWEDLGT